MPAPLIRSALIVAVPVAAALAVIGALALRVPGLVTLLVAAALIGVTTAGMVREAPGAGREAALDAGARAAGWTAGVLLVLAGLAALAGGVVTVLVAGTAAAAVLAVRLRRAGQPRVPAVQAPARPAPARSEGPTLLMPPVGRMTSRALGDEWVRGAALLDGRLDPVLRRAVVARRESVLDELERRDPAGFARWMAGGAAPGSDPAVHVRDLPAAGNGAA